MDVKLKGLHGVNFQFWVEIVIFWFDITWAKKQGKWRESRNGHLFWYPQEQKCLNKYINNIN